MTLRANVRRRARGFAWITLLMYAGAAAAIAGTIFAAYQWVDNSWETDAGIARGKRETDATYKARDAEALSRARDERDKLAAKVAALEGKLAADTAAASKRYQEGLADGEKHAAAAHARIRAGERLRDPGATGRPDCKPGAVPATAGAPGGRDGAKAGELSRPADGVLSALASDWLIDFAKAADDRTKQLSAAQDALAACLGSRSEAARTITTDPPR